MRKLSPAMEYHLRWLVELEKDAHQTLNTMFRCQNAELSQGRVTPILDGVRHGNLITFEALERRGLVKRVLRPDGKTATHATEAGRNLIANLKK